jgi:hypothetical protein
MESLTIDGMSLRRLLAWIGHIAMEYQLVVRLTEYLT